MSADLGDFLEKLTAQCDSKTISGHLSSKDAPDLLCKYIQSIIPTIDEPKLSSILDDLVNPFIKGCIADVGYAEHCKAQGNEAFAAAKYKDAIKHYSNSLRFINETDPEHTATAARLYGNRALCFEKLDQPSNAIRDASCAIQCDPKFTKAYWRRVTAHKTLKNHQAALSDAKKLLALQQASGDVTTDTESLIQDLENITLNGENAAKKDDGDLTVEDIIKEAQQAAETQEQHQDDKNKQNEPQWTSTHSVPWDIQDNDLAQQPECTVQDAANIVSKVAPVLSVAQTKEAGRCLCATSEVKAGTDVYSEAAFACMNTKAGRLQTCATCLKSLGSGAWFCPVCPMIAYCSPECRSADRYHRPNGPECGLPWSALMPMDVMLASRFARRLKESSGPEAQLAGALQTEAPLLPEEAVHHAALACIIHEVWQRASASRPTSGGATSFTVIDAFRALGAVQINGVAVVPAQRSGDSDRVGLALYPVSSMMNHACVPNVSIRFEGTSVIVRTTENVPAGGSFLHCYGPQVGEFTTEQRAWFLSKQYGFICDCPACTNPSPTEEEMVGLACPSGTCDGAVPVPGALDAGLASRYALAAGTGRCTKCNTTIPAPEWEAIVKSLEEGKAQYTQGVNELGDEKGTEALALLLRSLQSRKALHEYNQLRGATANALAMCFHVAGKPAQSIQQSRASLAIAERHYPPGSTNIAYQRLKLAMLLQSQGEEGKAAGKQLTLAAVKDLERHFGSQEVQDYAWI